VTRSSDRVGTGVMYILFGASPWLWLALMLLAASPLKSVIRLNQNTIVIGFAIVVGLGAVALVTALVVGIGAHVAHVIRRRAEHARHAGAPVRPDVPGTATTVARVASLGGLATVWGAFAAIGMLPLFGLDRPFGIQDRFRPLSLLLAAVTLVSLARGITHIARRPRQL
jgi:hypothetical protein